MCGWWQVACVCLVCNYLVAFVMYAGQGSTLALCPHLVIADKFQSHVKNLKAINCWFCPPWTFVYNI